MPFSFNLLKKVLFHQKFLWRRDETLQNSGENAEWVTLAETLDHLLGAIEATILTASCMEGM